MTSPITDRQREVVVRCRTMLTGNVVELMLGAEDGSALPPWEPGAHVDLVLDSATVRQYSLSGDPGDRFGYRVAVLRDPRGRGGSARVHEDVRVGDSMAIRGPRNHFRLEESASYVFVAGGIGIAPLLPMIRRADAAGAGWRLHYTGRERATMAYLPEVEALGRAREGRVRVSASAEAGRIDLAAVLATAEPGSLVYCCGPEPLLYAAQTAAAGCGLPCRTERFAAEKTFAANRTGDAADAPFTVRLASSGIELAVPAGRSLLDVLLDAGADVLTSCAEGTCGTCEVTVLEGVPDHRDSVLTPGEQASGDRMLVCVSRSRTPTLVLDL